MWEGKDGPEEDEASESESELGEEVAALPTPRPVSVPKLGSPPRGSSTSDLLSFYLSEVRRYPLLSQEEEKKYAVRYAQTGDREAAERLVTSNLRLVIKIAFQYHRQWANVLDLIQEGNVGLVEALSRYDPSREIRFSSYAQYWIRAMILRFLLDNFRLVRLGSTRAGRKLFFQLQKERDRLMQEGIQPSSRLIAERLGVSETEVDAVDQHMRSPALSLHAPAGDDPEGRTLSEVVPEANPQDPEEGAARSELSELYRGKFEIFVRDHIKDERERVIWDMRLVAQEPVSLSELGERFGVSKERIRQVEARLLKRLKDFLKQEVGEEIYFEFSKR